MASLASSLSIAVNALNASTAALQVTDNNIANANTPGYNRQKLIIQEAAPVQAGNISFGTGVDLQGYQSVRDELVQSQILQETSAQSSANSQLASLQQIEPTFTTSTQDIGTEMSALFSSLSALSATPSSSSLRQGVLTAGQNLASAFNTASSSLTSQVGGLNTQVDHDVDEINSLSQQIAALNPQIAQITAGGQDGGALEDQQNELILKLSALTNVSVTSTSTGVAVSTSNGTPLVVGTQSLALQTAIGTDGNQHVEDQSGNDITSSLTSGDLGGTIQTRDTTIPGLMNQLDTLANQFATKFNSVQASGYDQNGNSGQSFFSISATVAGSAGSISMAISDPAAVAASSDTSSGGNGNLASFASIQTSALPSGQTPADAYSSLVYQVGSLTSTASAESSATTSSLSQLNDQLSSVSGVSIDEETANLLAYQQSYEAAARVVSTIETLYTVLNNMGTTA